MGLMGTLKVYGIGRKGVNTDADPLSLDDQECTRMRNAVDSVTGGGLISRHGFAPFNGIAAGAAVTGGVGVPLSNLSSSGTRFVFIGRGPM
jgi:hypothetical protein